MEFLVVPTYWWDDEPAGHPHFWCGFWLGAFSNADQHDIHALLCQRIHVRGNWQQRWHRNTAHVCSKFSRQKSCFSFLPKQPVSVVCILQLASCNFIKWMNITSLPIWSWSRSAPGQNTGSLVGGMAVGQQDVRPFLTCRFDLTAQVESALWKMKSLWTHGDQLSLSTLDQPPTWKNTKIELVCRGEITQFYAKMRFDLGVII